MINTEQTISLRADVNYWVGRNFPKQRKYISHSNPVLIDENEYQVNLHLKNDGEIVEIGRLRIASNDIQLIGDSCKDVEAKLSDILESYTKTNLELDSLITENYEFHFDDGISLVGEMPDKSIDLLLTDPPYSISKPYVCESQIPRRLRKNGGDFIMPKGNFGEWDNNFPSPQEWTEIILPKVKGWAAIFCAQTQIVDYVSLLKEHKFVAVGPMVWHKTNPVPFNHKFKPINAWEAIVVGKRSGTKFNGHVVHNVFTHKSPSPQQRIHPTQKPEGLLSEFVNLFSGKGELVVDPFAGSGSTLFSAVTQGRKAIGYENDPIIFDKASKLITKKLGTLIHE